MLLQSIASIISGLLALLLGCAVFLKSHHSSERKTFAWLCFTMFGWLFTYGLMEMSPGFNRALMFARIGHSAVIFIPIAYLHFTRYLLRLPKLIMPYRLYYVFGVMFLILMWTTNLSLPTVIKQSWGWYPVGGILMFIEVFMLTAAVLLCWILFVIGCYRAKRTASFDEYNRLKYCCIALTVFSFGALDYLPKFGFHYYYPLGFATNAFFVSIVTYAILVHRLLDVNVVIRKSLVYSMLVSLITLTSLVSIVLVERLLQGAVGYRSVVGTVVAAFVIALGFTPLKEFVQRVVDRLFFHGSPAALAEENERLRHELTRSEKLKSVSTLAAGMAHEIKNPLSSIKIFSEYLPERYDDPDFRERFTRLIPHEVNRINGLVQRLLDFAKPAPPKPCAIRISTLLDETVELLNDAMVCKQIRLTRAYTSTDAAMVDAAQMKQVFPNLLLNSIEAMDKPGAITITTISENGHLHVQLTDTGKGIPKKELPQIFDPFYTTKATGTGLGLSVVHGIVKEHGGRVTIDSDVGQGTTVRVILPAAKAQDTGLKVQDAGQGN